jgi:2,4-didehydro-3-deoxy-L-rhamnonate hydrolase
LKLLRYGQSGAERPGLLDGDGNDRDLSGAIDDIDGRSLAPPRYWESVVLASSGKS